jgi:ribosomal protein L37AE/L43A
MIKRVCPHCGAENYSEAAEIPWKCWNCQEEIPVGN